MTDTYGGLTAEEWRGKAPVATMSHQEFSQAGRGGMSQALDEIDRLRDDLTAADLVISRLNSGAELQSLMAISNAHLEDLAMFKALAEKAEAQRDALKEALGDAADELEAVSIALQQLMPQGQQSITSASVLGWAHKARAALEKING